MLLAISCKKKDKGEPAADPPAGTPVTITAMQPMQGIPGDPIIITGTGFSANKANNSVKIGGKAADVTEASHTRLRVIVPQHPANGKVEITVNGTTNQTVTNLTVEVPDAVFETSWMTTGLPIRIRLRNNSLFSDNYEWFVDDKKVKESNAKEDFIGWLYTSGVHEVKLVSKRLIAGVLHTDTLLQDIEVPVDANLVAYYPMNSEPNDALGQQHATAVHTTAGVSRKDVAGGAMKFNGTNSVMTLPNGLLYWLGDAKTISLWFKAATPEIANPLISYQNAPVNGNPLPSSWNFGCMLSRDGTLYGKLGDQFNQLTDLIAVGNANGAWHHVCITGDDSGQSMYLDGVHVGSLSKRAGGSGNMADHNQIGAGFYGLRMGTTIVNIWTFFKGEIDDVRLYKTLLDADRVKALAQE